MASDELSGATVEYRVVIVHAGSRMVLTLDAGHGRCLPCVHVPQWARRAIELQDRIRTLWGVNIVVLEFLEGGDGFAHCAVTEILGTRKGADFKLVAPADIPPAEMSERQRVALAALLCDDRSSPLSRLGWIGQATAWLESETGTKLSAKKRIEQYNAGGAFALVRFFSENGQSFWLKATGEPNTHEFLITKTLSELAPEHLPKQIAYKSEWNAWLMQGDGHSADLPQEPLCLVRFLQRAVQSLAKLQLKTQGYGSKLLEAGAFDQSLGRFQRSSRSLFEFLDEAMSNQESTKVPRLKRTRLEAIRLVFDEVCRRTEDLDLPPTITHGDLHPGNIVVGGERYKFIDWSEAYVGVPLISLQRLILLNKTKDSQARESINRDLGEIYRKIWSQSIDPKLIDEGARYMPALSVGSALIGRCGWWETPQRSNPQRQSYARTLVRGLDLALTESGVSEAL